MPSPSLAESRTHIYEAALDPDAWSRVIDSLGTLTRAHSGAVFVADWSAREGLVHCQRGLDRELWETWLSGAIAIDEWSGALSALPGGFVATGRSVVDRRTLGRSAFYNDYLAPRRIEDVLCASLAKENNVHSVLSLYRHEGFDSSEADVLTQLVPDLRLAVRLQRELGELRTRAESAERALDAIPVALLLLDAQGRVLHANGHGEGLLRRADGVRTVDGKLFCTRSSDTTRLHGAIARVAQAAAGRLEAGAVATIASRGAHRRALGILVAPLLRATGGSTLLPTTLRADARVLVTVSDPDEEIRLSAKALEQQFGLTPAEARLAVALASRRSLDEYAALAGVSMNTVRSTLKAVFAKTGCNRQSELVLVLASGAVVTASG